MKTLRPHLSPGSCLQEEQLSVELLFEKGVHQLVCRQVIMFGIVVQLVVCRQLLIEKVVQLVVCRQLLCEKAVQLVI